MTNIDDSSSNNNDISINNSNNNNKKKNDNDNNNNNNINLLCQWIDWFLCNGDLRYERVKLMFLFIESVNLFHTGEKALVIVDKIALVNNIRQQMSTYASFIILILKKISKGCKRVNFRLALIFISKIEWAKIKRVLLKDLHLLFKQ